MKKEKIEEYLKTHKRPVDIKFLADRFLISRTHTSRILGELENEGIAKRRKSSKETHWGHVAIMR